MKVILGITKSGAGKNVPFFVLPDGVIRTFIDGWALISFACGIDSSNIRTSEMIKNLSDDGSEVITEYEYKINGLASVFIAIKDNIQLEELKMRVEELIAAAENRINTIESELLEKAAIKIRRDMNIEAMELIDTR